MKFFSRELITRIKHKILMWLHKYNVKHIEVASRENKLSSFSYLEVLGFFIKSKFPNEHIIILTNINVGAKNVFFWANVKTNYMNHFLRDVVFLRCKDISELNKLMDNISEDFAEAYGYLNGILIRDNKEGV